MKFVSHKWNKLPMRNSMVFFCKILVEIMPDFKQKTRTKIVEDIFKFY